eukprot:IDg14072t1
MASNTFWSQAQPKASVGVQCAYRSARMGRVKPAIIEWQRLQPVSIRGGRASRKFVECSHHFSRIRASVAAESCMAIIRLHANQAFLVRQFLIECAVL